MMMCMLIFAGAADAKVSYVDMVPLTKVIKTTAKDCRPMNTWKVPVIAWGGDIHTSLANGNATKTVAGSVFAEHKLPPIELYRQDDFIVQVTSFLNCDTPFLRGTMGMINQAAEVANRDPRTKLVTIYQLSWSTGGDVLVVKGDINTPADLKGKTIVVQAYGPHVDYLMNVLRSAGLNASDVKIKFVKDLIVTGTESVSPASAFRDDPTVDAVFVISPDAAALTSGGGVGTGAEDSVKGAHILLSTKTADKVIGDVYAVRQDFFDANREVIQRFVHALLAANEKMAAVVSQKDTAPVPYRTMMSAAAGLLLDNPNSVDDVVGLYGDMRMVGYVGNVKFFADQSYPRSYDALQAEIQPAFMQLGLLKGRVPLDQAEWDWKAMAQGLHDTNGVDVQRFNLQAVQQVITAREKKIGSTQEGELFRFEIFFGPNQNVFSAEQYHDEFDQVIKLANEYGGALLEVEGHSDPLGYLTKKQSGAQAAELQQIRQSAKNLSYARASAVKESLIAYAQGKKITLDSSQFGVVGLGVSKPNTPNCKLGTGGDIDLSCAPATKPQWDATRRVVFRVLQVEAEPQVFKPLQ